MMRMCSASRSAVEFRTHSLPQQPRLLRVVDAAIVAFFRHILFCNVNGVNSLPLGTWPENMRSFCLRIRPSWLSIPTG